MAQRVKKKERDKLRYQTQSYKQRRKVRQYSKLKDISKNSSAPARHKSNKLSPKDACKSQAGDVLKANSNRGIKQKRESCCKNCRLAHSGPCVEPGYKELGKRKRRSKGDKEDDSYLEDMYQTLLANQK